MMQENEHINQYLAEIKRNLDEADHVRKVDDIGVATQKRLGSIVICMKKIILKLIKWAILPNQNRQTHYNGKMLNAISLMESCFEESYADLSTKYEEMFEKLCAIDRILPYIESQRKRIMLLEKKVALLKQESESLKKINDYFKKKMNISCDLSLLENSQLDYFEFENKMRGERRAIKDSQRPYVEYFKNNGGGVILDLGCGRGEFLELMYDYGIPTKGVDMYVPFVNYCSQRGFEVEYADALTHLSKYADTSIGGIFMGQVVEHLNSDYLVALIRMAYKKLKPGCYFILETPNPEILSTYQNFYIDSGHSTPVHYLYLKEVFQQVGFDSVERFDNSFSEYPYKLEEIQGKQIDNLKEFNAGIRAANELIFGYRDYTLIARK